MSKIFCKCGEMIDLSGIPSSNQYLMISDVDFDCFQGNVDAEYLYSKMDIVVKCPSCKRLHMFNEGIDKTPLIYLLENL